MTVRRPDSAGTTRRRYESPRRLQNAAQTRAAVLDAAIGLFSENGWTGTGMRDVARVAGVAVETVYSNFGSKTELLLAAIDVSVVGDTEAIPLAERPEFAALGQGSRAARERAAARLVRQIHERTAGIGRALREAAAGDAELAKRLAEAEERRRMNVTQGAHLIAGGPITDTIRDGLWAVLGMEVYQLLVVRAGWSADRYEDWLGDTIGRLLRPVGKGK